MERNRHTPADGNAELTAPVYSREELKPLTEAKKNYSYIETNIRDATDLD